MVLPTLFVCGCATTPEVAAPVIVDPSFTLYGSSRGVDVQVALKAAESDGLVMLCAAIAGQASTGSARSYIEYWRDNAQVELGGHRLADGMSHAAIYDDDKSVKGKNANCHVIDEDWRAEYASRRVVLRIDAPSASHTSRERSTLEIAAGVAYGIASLVMIPFYLAAGGYSSCASSPAGC